MTMPGTEPTTAAQQMPLLELPPPPEPSSASKPGACAAALGKAMGGARRCSIADFRRDNAKALEALNRECVQLCRGLDLIAGGRVGVDGSFFKASASAASVKSLTQLKRGLAALDREIDACHAELEADDATETDSADRVSFDAEQREALKAQVAETQATIKTLEAHGETQRSHTDFADLTPSGAPRRTACPAPAEVRRCEYFHGLWSVRARVLSHAVPHRRHLHRQPREAHRRGAEGGQDHRLRPAPEPRQSVLQLPQAEPRQG